MRAQLALGGAVVDHVARLVVGHEELVDSGAALVAGEVAGTASDSAVDAIGHAAPEDRFLRRAGLVGRLALGAELAHQALCQHAVQRRGEQVRLDAHVDQARDGAGRVVGVERGEHQVAGERCLHGDLCGLQVADLADHHHVGVLSQDPAQRARERHLDAGIHLRLPDAVQLVLDRVLHREDVARLAVQARERGVERRRLARARGAGDEEDAVRLLDQRIDVVAGGRAHAERIEREPARLLVQQAQHHALAVRGRNGRDAHVDRAARDAQRDAPVLRQALLGDVERGHDLHARDHRWMQPAARFHHVAQRAVDAIAHQRARFEALEVHVGCALAHRLREERVDEPDDGRVVLGFEEVGDFRKLLGELRKVDRLAHVIDDRLGGRGLARVGERQAVVEFLRREQHLADGLARHAAHFRERGGLGIGTDPDFERAGHLARGDHALRLREGVGKQAHGMRIELARVHGSFEGRGHLGEAVGVPGGVPSGCLFCSSIGGIGVAAVGGSSPFHGSWMSPCRWRMYS